MTSRATTPPFCQFCGYDMSGTLTGICPECGKPVLRFTDRAREVLVHANAHAIAMIRRESEFQQSRPWWKFPTAVPDSILPRHILMGICTGPQGIAYHALAYWGVSPLALCRAIGRHSPIPYGQPIDPTAKLPLSTSCQRVVDEAILLAAEFKQSWVGTEHLLLAVTASPLTRPIRRSLEHCRITRERLAWYIAQNANHLANQSADASSMKYIRQSEPTNPTRPPQT